MSSAELGASHREGLHVLVRIARDIHREARCARRGLPEGEDFSGARDLVKHGVRVGVCPKGQAFVWRFRKRWKNSFEATIVSPVDGKPAVVEVSGDGSGHTGE